MSQPAATKMELAARLWGKANSLRATGNIEEADTFDQGVDNLCRAHGFTRDEIKRTYKVYGLDEQPQQSQQSTYWDINDFMRRAAEAARQQREREEQERREQAARQQTTRGRERGSQRWTAKNWFSKGYYAGKSGKTQYAPWPGDDPDFSFDSDYNDMLRDAWLRGWKSGYRAAHGYDYDTFETTQPRATKHTTKNWFSRGYEAGRRGKEKHAPDLDRESAEAMSYWEQNELRAAWYRGYDSGERKGPRA